MYRIYAYENGTEVGLIHDPNLITEGYGVLSPKLTLEINKAGSLEFVMPPSHKLYNKLSKLKTELWVYDDDEILFKGRVLNDEKDFYNQKKVYVEGRLAYLLDSIIGPYEGPPWNVTDNSNTYPTLARWLEYYIEGLCNSQINRAFNCKINHKDYDYKLQGSGANGWYENNTVYTNFKNDGYMTIFDEINKQLVEEYDGYLVMRHSGIIDLGYDISGNTVTYDCSTNPNTVFWESEDKAPRSDQIIEFGANLLDITEHISGEDIYTVLIMSYEYEVINQSVEERNGTYKDSVVIQRDDDTIATYGLIYRHHDYGSIGKIRSTTPSGDAKIRATAVAENLLKKDNGLKTTLNIKAIDLHLINVDIKRIHLADMVQVLSIPHDIYREIQCTKIVYDLVNPDQNEYTFGRDFETLTEKQVKSQKNKNKYSSVGEQPIAATTLSLNNTASGTETTSTSQGGIE